MVAFIHRRVVTVAYLAVTVPLTVSLWGYGILGSTSEAVYGSALHPSCCETVQPTPTTPKGGSSGHRSNPRSVHPAGDRVELVGRHFEGRDEPQLERTRDANAGVRRSVSRRRVVRAFGVGGERPHRRPDHSRRSRMGEPSVAGARHRGVGWQAHRHVARAEQPRHRGRQHAHPAKRMKRKLA